MSSLKIITTQDGSHSLLHEQLNETYHSIHGAIQESKHVFIENGLGFVKSLGKSEIQILEIGFGTGLNALLTLQRSLVDNLSIRYTTLEAFPIDEEVWSRLNYAVSPEMSMWFEKLHRTDWNEWRELSSAFHIRKLHTTLQGVMLEDDQYDLIYFDAFAPNKQPEMWELPVLDKVTRSLKADGVLVTYCAKGQLKRDLQDLKLKVESLAGPPGKREMVRAIK